MIGEVAGLELRYLADAAPVIVLGIGLIVAGRNGIEQIPERPAPLQFPQWNLRHTAAAGVVLVAVVGTVVSTVRYVHFWSGPFPAKSFTQNVIRESKQDGVRVADVAVPDLVLTGTSFPYNLPSRLFKPLGEDRVSATTLGNDLDILTSSGEW